MFPKEFSLRVLPPIAVDAVRWLLKSETLAAATLLDSNTDNFL